MTEVWPHAPTVTSTCASQPQRATAAATTPSTIELMTGALRPRLSWHTLCACAVVAVDDPSDLPTFTTPADIGLFDLAVVIDRGAVEEVSWDTRTLDAPSHACPTCERTYLQVRVHYWAAFEELLIGCDGGAIAGHRLNTAKAAHHTVRYHCYLEQTADGPTPAIDIHLTNYDNRAIVLTASAWSDNDQAALESLLTEHPDLLPALRDVLETDTALTMTTAVDTLIAART